MKKYDLIILGGGPAGYLAAERAKDAGLSTMVAEKRSVGGVCLNEGCIPTKTYLYSGKMLDSLGHSKEYGVTAGDVAFDHAAVLARKNKVVKTLVGGVEATLRKKGIDVVRGEASMAAPAGPDSDFIVFVNGEAYAAANILIATGSVPVFPPIEGLQAGVENGSIISSRELLDIDHVPGELVIIGAGVIGLEMAEYFSDAGSKVTVIEMLDKIAGDLDPDAASVLQKKLASKGITFCLGSRVTSLKDNTVTYVRGDETKSVHYDKALLCVGRKANLGGLESVPLYTERGAIVTDEMCRTNIPGIYAAGDVNGKYMLAHVAYREAEVAINNIAGKPDEMDYSAIPAVIYTNPESATAGLSEKAAREKGYDIEVKQVSINFSGRHVAEKGISDGFCKLIIDKKQNVIIGATLLCTYASEIIYPIALMIQNKIPVESIKKTIFPHPTVCEIIREAIFSE